ncbi:MAG: hypothetical protein KGL95_02245 [Patescibacteria group bacterium]|uniref:Uncharacterized protein n=1 Tax=Candidatus Nitrosotalea okcheonensis TaxID=1903276 RepID=A0A2H1FFC8_9ARCH|nr:hypothetical protein [Patescibacteria group bacterium]SMH71471.1 protein of unknown function [Candidatus Nitrosotalea okcheonensis]
MSLPRKEYKTITVKVESHAKFLRAIKEAKKAYSGIDNSEFLDLLVDMYKKSKAQ